MKKIITIAIICALTNLVFSQNFGIDVSSPIEKLDVNGNIQASTAFIGIGGHGSSYMHLSHSNYKGSGQYAVLQHGTNGNTYLNSVGTGNMYFRNSNSDRMILLSTGEFGIGTTTPGAKLHVFSSDAEIAEIYATGSSQGSGMFYAGQSTVYGGGFVYDGDGTPALVGGTDRITFFRRDNGTDVDVMSYAYSSDIVRISNLIGTGTRMVVAEADGDLATQALPSAGQCYERWGVWGCATGYTEVLQGRTGGLESFSSGGGSGFGNIVCVSTTPGAVTSWAGSYYARFMRATAAATGMQKVQPRCSICCTGGCYTAFGVNTCATGYTAMYTGRTGGTELYNGGQIYGKTLCIDVNATVDITWSGYDTRLMRHVETTLDKNGMEHVSNACAVCCKN